MTQVEAIARENAAVRVTAITLGMGPLSGVEEQLLKNAYPIATAGTIAEGAELFIHPAAIRVRCTACGKESAATPNRLICGHCKNWCTELISGDELLLLRVELDKADPATALH